MPDNYITLPQNAQIAPAKLTDYLLKPQAKDDKSAFLAQAGYTLSNPLQLEQDIRAQLLTLPAEQIEASDYGPKYRIRGTLLGPSGRELRVDSIWMTEEATGVTKFITLYPEKP